MATTAHYVDNAVLTDAVRRHVEDRAAAETLALSVARIAHGIYMRYSRPPRNDDDMAEFQQDCSLLSSHWAKRFDPARNSKAFNYITTCVCNQLRQHQRDLVGRQRILAGYQRHIRETTTC